MSTLSKQRLFHIDGLALFQEGENALPQSKNCSTVVVQ